MGRWQCARFFKFVVQYSSGLVFQYQPRPRQWTFSLQTIKVQFLFSYNKFLIYGFFLLFSIFSIPLRDHNENQAFVFLKNRACFVLSLPFYLIQNIAVVLAISCFPLTVLYFLSTYDIKCTFLHLELAQNSPIKKLISKHLFKQRLGLKWQES